MSHHLFKLKVVEDYYFFLQILRMSVHIKYWAKGKPNQLKERIKLVLTSKPRVHRAYPSSDVINTRCKDKKINKKFSIY
jgi:hypothetical protein